MPDYYAEKLFEWRRLAHPWAVVEDIGGPRQDMPPFLADRDDAAHRLADEHGVLPELLAAVAPPGALTEVEIPVALI